MGMKNELENNLTDLPYMLETPFVHDTGLIYTLRHRGWRKGKPEMENDVWISINGRTITEKQRNQIAQVITKALNENFPHRNLEK
jgi:hypothetical protein